MEVGSGAEHAHISDEVTSESGWKAGSAHTSDCIPASLGIFLPVALSQTSSTLGLLFFDRFLRCTYVHFSPGLKNASYLSLDMYLLGGTDDIDFCERGWGSRRVFCFGSVLGIAGSSCPSFRLCLRAARASLAEFASMGVLEAFELIVT